VAKKHLETHRHQESANESQQWWHASSRNACWEPSVLSGGWQKLA